MTLPNFIIGGTAAGGTSFLGAAIIQHPDIYLPYPMEPECHFFLKSWEYEQGLDSYQRRWFADVGRETAIGERSSSYLFGGGLVADRIASALPNVKLIFTLRNPIERAWGNYRFTVLQGLEELPFLEALEREPQRISAQEGRWAEIQPHNYTGRGMYGEQLDAFRLRFDPEEMLILKSEMMSEDSSRTFSKVFRFLDVDENFEPVVPPAFSSMNVVDPAAQAKARRILGPRFTDVILAIREKRDPYQTIDPESESHRAAVESISSNVTSRKIPMDPKARVYLQSVFADDIRKLSDSLDFPVDDWK